MHHFKKGELRFAAVHLFLFLPSCLNNNSNDVASTPLSNRLGLQRRLRNNLFFVSPLLIIFFDLRR
jgi:hypothetical protein